MTARLLFITLLLAAACARPDASRVAQPRSRLLLVRFAPKVLAALDAASVSTPLPLELSVPGDGAVIPWTFPEGTIQWDDAFTGNTFRVRIRDAGGDLVTEYQTFERRLDLPEAEWGRVREAVGEGGAFEVELTGASIMPSGRLLRGPTRQVSRARFSEAGEHPTGRVLYGDRLRHAGATPGPVAADARNSVAMQLEMDGRTRVLLDRLPGVRALREEYKRLHGHETGTTPELPAKPAGERAPEDPAAAAPETGAAHPASDEPEFEPFQAPKAENVTSRSVDFTPIERSAGAVAWRQLPRKYNDNCLSCHSISGDARFLAVTGISAEGTPKGWAGTNGTTYVIRLEDQKILHTLPSARNVRFHPLDPGLMLYTQMGMETAFMRRTSTYHADLHVLDLSTGQDRVVSGADDPERCEMNPDWSPDGRHIVFMRSKPRTPCDGRRGHYDLATVPWTGEPARATPLAGASDNGRANLWPTWSRDGRWIVFQRADQGLWSAPSGDLWVVPATGGEARRLSISTDAMESLHAFSPDGRWLAFLSNRDLIDRPRGYVARFFDDGRTAPAMPLPAVGGATAYIDYLDWAPSAPAP
jgi:hypothetical protein